jgi:uracil-DNA glycosylase family 4
MNPNQERDAESILGFWRDAGVEVLFEDAPVDRTLTQPKPEVRALPQRAVGVPVRPVAVATGPSTPDPAALATAISDAHRLAAAANTLDELKAAIATFEGCPLRYEGAKQVVFGRGNPNAPVVIIGEAPGADEDVQGFPFVGRAGKLLDRMLAAAGLTDKVFITNTVYWRPPGNRTPSLQEQATCAPFLERTLAIIRPQILMCAGAASAKSVLKRTEGILAMRGNWFEWRAEEGGLSLPVLPTLHPAFLLRQPQAKKKAWADLLSLTERLDQPPAPLLQTET